jgi:phospholipid/cholesterol/gamma-HCH transport system substrate-binding protein
MILTQDPAVCHHGYESTNERDPESERGNAPMNTKAHCGEPFPSNPRGAQHAPRVAPDTALDPGPAVATYDRDTGKLRWDDGTSDGPSVTYTGGAGAAFGRESWKWLLLQPLMPQQ